MEALHTATQNIVASALEAARSAAAVGRCSFTVAGKTFDIMKVTPTEYYVQCEGKDAGIRIYRCGRFPKVELA